MAARHASAFRTGMVDGHQGIGIRKVAEYLLLQGLRRTRRRRSKRKRKGYWWRPPKLAVWSVVVLALLSSTGDAQSSAYCDKVRAQAHGEAALAMTPRLFGQGLRFPDASTNLGAVIADQYQVRVGLSFSLVDMLRGLAMNRAGEADCRAHGASQALQRVLAQVDRATYLPAYRAQRDFLARHRSEWRGLVKKAQKRLEERIITVVEYTNFRSRIDVLENKLIDLDGRIGVLESERAPLPSAGLDALVRNYVGSAQEYERRRSSLKALDAWEVSLRGGAIPLPELPPEWFGAVVVSYSLGGPIRNYYQGEYLEARARELRTASYELPARVKTLKAELGVRRSEAKHARALLRQQSKHLSEARQILERDRAGTAHERDSVAMRLLTLESEGAFLQAFIQAIDGVSGEIRSKTRADRQPVR
ncbi:MAG: hypothetical protein OXU20_18430 [Myxococcales bacterium]|nr:hypothetical protein [Myxococcales bacterium]